MSKTRKELAFLHDLYIANDWTMRFADIFDKHFKFSDEKKILYVNAGTGNHALELREKLAADAELIAYSDDEELNAIAQAKADALRAKIIFTGEFPQENFDAVIADASFVRPAELRDFLDEIIHIADKQVIFFLPTAGSFGEIYSFLWETFFNLNLLDKSEEIERLIAEIPTIEKVKETAEFLGLKKVESFTNIELFEFENGKDFVKSPLVADFLLPARLDFLTEKEQKQVSKQLAQVIDEDGTLSFRFSIKATLISGEKS